MALAESNKGQAGELKRRSLAGLNGLNFFVADMLTGFGPFVTVYLTANGWHPTDVGFVLSLGSMAAIAGQVPAGLLVDAVPLKRLITAAGVGGSSSPHCCSQRSLGNGLSWWRSCCWGYPRRC